MARSGTTNMKVRLALTEHHMAQWQLADILKVAESTFWGYMRYEWPDELQNIVCDIINGEPFDELKVWAMLRNVKPKTKRELTKKHDEQYYIEQYAEHIIRQVECLEQEMEDERNWNK